jgi:hypothetical protein
MWKAWWSRVETEPALAPAETRDAFVKAVEDARGREDAFRPLFEQLAFALRVAESPIPIDRATIPLSLEWGPDKVKELAAQIKLSPYLKTNIQALVHHFREDQRDLKNAEKASELLLGNTNLAIRLESVQTLYKLFHFLPASRERFRDYPVFYALFGGGETQADAGMGVVPEELRFYLVDGAHGALGYPEGGLRLDDGADDDDLRDPETLAALLAIAPLCLELGLDLVPLVEPVLGGDLLTRLAPMRRAIALELGFVMPGVQFQDNLDLQANAYKIQVRGNAVAAGELMVGYHLAVETPESESAGESLVGFPTTDPATGRTAYWVTRAEGARASRLGYEVFDTTQMLVRHLDEVVRGHAHELLGLEEVSAMVDHLRERLPQTVEAVLPEKLELADYHQILRNLLRERVSIRDQVTILERLAHCAKPVHPFYLADRFGENKASIESIMLMEISAQIRPLNDPTVLTEMVRVALSRQICAGLADAGGTLDVVQLSAQVEGTILNAIQTHTTGQALTLAPSLRDAVTKAITSHCQRMDRPVVLCDPRIRPFVRALASRALPRLTVLSHGELHPQFTVHSVGTVSLVES